MLPWARQAKHPFEIFDVRAGYNYMGLSVSVLDCGPALVYFSLSLSLSLFLFLWTATLVPEFAVEDLPLGRTAALVPEFAVKDLPLGRKL